MSVAELINLWQPAITRWAAEKARSTDLYRVPQSQQLTDSGKKSSIMHVIRCMELSPVEYAYINERSVARYARNKNQGAN